MNDLKSETDTTTTLAARRSRYLRPGFKEAAMRVDQLLHDLALAQLRKRVAVPGLFQRREIFGPCRHVRVVSLPQLIPIFCHVTLPG